MTAQSSDQLVQRHQLSLHLKSAVAEFAGASCLVVAAGAFPCRAGGVAEAFRGGAGEAFHRHVGRRGGAAGAFPGGAAGACRGGAAGRLGGAGGPSYAAADPGRAGACLDCHNAAGASPFGEVEGPAYALAC